MPRKCKVCGKPVSKGYGLYYGGRLIHKACRGIAKIQRNALC